MKSTWRERFRPQILALFDANPGATVLELRKVFREAWPFAATAHDFNLYPERRGWVYQAWRLELAEVCAERGVKGVTRRAEKHRRRPRAVTTPKRQMQARLEAARLADFEARQMRLL